MIEETMARPIAAAGSDVLLAMLLQARDDATKLNQGMTAYFLEMACLDLALQGAASWARAEARIDRLRPDPALKAG